MTPFTPITKVDSIEPVEEESPITDWPSHAWIKGKVIHSSSVGFTIDDGTGTIGVLSDQGVPIGQTVVVYGKIRVEIRGNLKYPDMIASEVHVILFFPTIAHLITLIIFVIITGIVSTSIYWFRKKNRTY
jgi:hypothetical protein